MPDDNAKYMNFLQKPDFEQILSNPILDIAARFWDDDRYEAFRICYRSMRVIDDLVDDRKSIQEEMSDEERGQIALTMMQWFGALKEGKPQDDFQVTLIETVERLKIPLWPWQRLVRAMLYDLDHDGFKNFLVFLRYTEGAAIAPASVFMHLCGVQSKDGQYAAPVFDIRRAARPLALFSYLVHIIRDFQKDSLNGLNYFADSLLREHNLDPADLKSIAESGKIPDGFRKLIGHYHHFAEYYRIRARGTIDKVRPIMSPPYQLSLEIIYNLYLQIYERIDADGGRFTTDELNPTPQEVRKRIHQTVIDFRPIE
ncbi:MAG: squalene/phytoene synthase family protein [Candidatus Zixiibacteriota bacterium]|nr:MAG: squalene/phytoene synthase family protein [candidate division Zixibacteria bacterium]